MGLFSNKANDHRKLLADAGALVGRYRRAKTDYFDLSTVPLEFRAAVYPRLKNILWHLGNTSGSEIGDPKYLRELAEDVGFCTLLLSGRYSQETQRNFRTMCFDQGTEHLASFLDSKPKDNFASLRSLDRDSLADAISGVEAALEWFSQLPAPQSKKYSAAQAATLVQLAKKKLADMNDVERSRKGAAKKPAATKQACPSCRTDNDSDAAFCKRCGLSLSADCPKCGQRNDADASFCKKCGADRRARAPES